MYFLPFRLNARQKLLLMLHACFIWRPVEVNLLDQERKERYTTGIDRSSFQASILRINKKTNPFQLEIFIKFYGLLSTTTHMLNCILNVVLLTDMEKELTGNNALTCYLPRLVVHDFLGQKHLVWLSILFSSYNLVWRFVVVFVEQSFDLHLIPFILIEQETIEAGISDLTTSSSSPNTYVHSSKPPTLVQNIIFYELLSTSCNRIELLKRPNRTPEARIKLLNAINSHFNFAVSLFCTVACALVPIGIITILYRQDFVYPGCDTSDPKLVYWRITSSVYLSLLLLWDGFLSLYYIPATGFILILDLMIYWREIENRLERLAYLMPIYRMMVECRRSGDEFESEDDECRHLNRSRHLSPSPENNHHEQYIEQTEEAYKLQESLNIEREMLELQSMLADFFKQLKSVDKLISSIMAIGFYVWLSYNGTLCYTGLQLDTQSTNPFVRGFQLAAFLIMYMLSSKVIHLKRNTEPAYRMLSNLMAIDPSNNKTRWMILTMYYTGRRMHGFTILHSEHYSLLTFLKIISYTFSVIFFVERFRTGFKNSSG